MTKLIIETNRTAYSIRQVSSTMTVGQLKAFLEDFEDDTPIYLSFDRGYTYSGLDEYDFNEIGDEEEEDE